MNETIAGHVKQIYLQAKAGKNFRETFERQIYKYALIHKPYGNVDKKQLQQQISATSRRAKAEAWSAVRYLEKIAAIIIYFSKRKSLDPAQFQLFNYKVLQDATQRALPVVDFRTRRENR